MTYTAEPAWDVTVDVANDFAFDGLATHTIANNRQSGGNRRVAE